MITDKLRHEAREFMLIHRTISEKKYLEVLEEEGFDHILCLKPGLGGNVLRSFFILHWTNDLRGI